MFSSFLFFFFFTKRKLFFIMAIAAISQHLGRINVQKQQFLILNEIFVWNLQITWRYMNNCFLSFMLQNRVWVGIKISYLQLNVQTFYYFNFTLSLSRLTLLYPLIISCMPGSKYSDDGRFPIRALWFGCVSGRRGGGCVVPFLFFFLFNDCDVSATRFYRGSYYGVLNLTC